MFWSLFFFVKQKTAYEMRISDWSSDVCSSDLQWSRRSGDMIANKYGNPMKLAGWIFLPSLAFMLAGCGDKDPKNTEDLSNSTHLAARYYEGPRPEGVSTQNEAITTTFYIPARSEEHTSELQSLMRTSYAVFC